MLRIVFLADTHLGFDYPVKPRIKRRRRGPDFFANFRQVLEYARQTRPDIVLHGGDLFFRAKIPPKIIDLVYADLFDFAGEGIPLLIVPGNHERSILPASLFLNHPNIHIFDKPKTFQLSLSDCDVSLSGFPCERKLVKGKFPELLRASGWYEHDSDLKILCMHQAVEGATVGPSEFTFRYGQDVVQRKDIPEDAAAILCGHIHRQQVLGNPGSQRSKSPLVIYSGSIERTSFAEKDEVKGFYELEFSMEGGTWGLRELRFIELPSRPMVDLVLDGNVSPENLVDFIHSQIAVIDPNSVIRVGIKQETNPEVIKLINSKLLRDILPESMNYQFSGEFRQRLTGGNQEGGSVIS